MATKKKAGRPKEFNRNTFKRICSMIVDGMSVVDIASKLGITRQTIYNWRNSDPDFGEMYRIAQEMRAEDLTFETLKIANDDSRDIMTDPVTGKIIFNNGAIQRDKLRIVQINKLLSFLNPKKYAPNQRLDITTGGRDLYGGIVIEAPDLEEDEDE